MRTPETTGKRILVLDDNPQMGKIAAVALSNMGYTVRAETCPAKSIRYILDGEFDILLTDYHMPGLDGFQVAHLLRTMGSMILIILHTGNSSEICMDDLPVFGILGVIKKPLSLEEFKSAFSTVIKLTKN